MKIFVQRYPAQEVQEDHKITSAMLAEIQQDHLFPFLQSVRRIEQDYETVAEYFRAGVHEILETGYIKDSFEPFLRRPHITVFCGSRPGNEDCAVLFKDLAEETGRQIQQSGHDFWYGGGDSGLMGSTNNGFINARNLNNNLSDQYSVQVIPSKFVVPPPVLGKKVRPANEGLSNCSDAAVIINSFSSRREFLSNRSTAFIGLPGAPGTFEELFGVITANKTGLRDIPVFIVNPRLPNGRNFYDSMIEQIETYIECGLDRRETYNNVHFVTEPQEAFAILHQQQSAAGTLPETLYRAYCAEHGVKPTVPRHARLPRRALPQPGGNGA